MRKELDEVKNAMKGKTTINLDVMIKRTDSPFTTSVLECPLPPNFRLPQLEVYDVSIANFDKLSDSFVRHFIEGQCHKRPTSYLLIVKQQEGETPREYVKRFNKAVLEIDEADKQVIMTTSKLG
nr:hypothetical protein CFP56_39135 [Quercus suber]